jgi:hypothetical protein
MKKFKLTALTLFTSYYELDGAFIDMSIIEVKKRTWKKI